MVGRGVWDVGRGYLEDIGGEIERKNNGMKKKL